jgi:hypothetical protein
MTLQKQPKAKHIRNLAKHLVWTVEGGALLLLVFLSIGSFDVLRVLSGVILAPASVTGISWVPMLIGALALLSGSWSVGQALAQTFSIVSKRMHRKQAAGEACPSASLGRT